MSALKMGLLVSCLVFLHVPDTNKFHMCFAHKVFHWMINDPTFRQREEEMEDNIKTKKTPAVLCNYSRLDIYDV